MKLLLKLIKWQMSRRLARFCLVGASGVLVNMGLLIALTEGFGIPYAISSLFAIEASVISNFVLNNAWTWADRRTTSFFHRLVKYHAVAGITAFATNWCLLIVLTSFLRMDYRISNLIGIAAGVVLNFLLNHVWTFGTHSADDTSFSATAKSHAAHPAQGSESRALWAAVITVLAFTIAKVIFAARAELLPEEAYYWTYLQHPALGYFDHPPMVAWVIGLGTAIFGDTELGVRFGTILLSSGSSVLIFLLTRLWFGSICAGWSVVLFNLLPIFIGTGVLAFPDGPLIFFWLLTMFAVSKAVGGGSANSGGHARMHAILYWLLAGLAFGGALLSKYTAVMLGFSLGLFLLLSRSYGQWFVRPHLWLAAVLALLVFSPVILWNSQHEWASFLFQSTRTSGHRSQELKEVLEFWLIQIGILGPIAFALLGWTAWRGVRRGWFARDERWSFTVSFFLPSFAVFVLASFKTDVHINWTAPAFLSLIVGAPAIFREGIENRLRFSARSWRAAGWCVVLFPIGATALGMSIMILGAPKQLIASRTGGWRQLAQQVATARTELENVTSGKAFLLGVDKYNIAAELSFYTRDPANCINTFALGRQGLGFRYWTDLKSFEQRPAIAVLTKRDERAVSMLRAHFEQVDAPQRVELATFGSRTRTVWLFNCRGYHVAGIRSGQSNAHTVLGTRN